MSAPVNPSVVDGPIDSIDVSDHWLRVFDAVATEGSFTAAGRRLHVGQPSVSHAIKQLETALGVALFDRSGPRTHLTDSGQELRSHIRPAFDALDLGVAAVRRRPDRGEIALSVSTSFATWWLLPRLASFKAAHPDIELRCITSDNDGRVGRDDADVWIPLGGGEWPGLDASVLTAERVAAVAAPTVASGLADADDPGVVADLPLIHLEEHYRPRFDWARWCSVKGVAPPLQPGSIQSNDYAVVVQAALDGQGVALGWDHIVGPLVAAGRLVEIGGTAIETDEPFVLLRRPGHRSTAVDRLVEWLAGELR